MIDSIFTLFSLTTGLILLNCIVIVGAHRCQTSWMQHLSIELRYLVLLSFAFVITLVGNQWVAGKHLFPILLILALVFLASCSRNLHTLDKKLVVRDSLSLLAVQTISILFVFIVFRMYRYWLLEGANHDSLVYYQGLIWANESPLFVGNEAVRAKWGLGICGEGSGWIGFNCPLYRGGTYTLAAWIQYFAPRITGNGLYLVITYSSTVAWFATRLLTTQSQGLKAALLNTVLALFVALSTGAIGALVNTNLATVMGSITLVTVLAFAFSTHLTPQLRFGMMALWCAIGAHFYAESVFYSGLLVVFLLLLESPRILGMLKFKGFLSLCFLLILIVFGVGNVAVGQAFTSLLFFSGLKGGDWPSWYSHHHPILWIGSFVAGFVVGKSVLTIVAFFAVLLTLSTAMLLIFWRGTRTGILALIGLSVLAVTYVELTHYQYGEHKIINLLGPSWAFAVTIVIRRLITLKSEANSGRIIANAGKAAGAIFICLMSISSIFISQSVALLNSLQGMHSLDFGLSKLTSYIRPGDTVVIEDSDWINIQKYHRSHYMIFQLHNQGAKAVMPSLASDKLRGGYFRGSVENTLNRARQIDWIVVSQYGYSLKNKRFLSVLGNPVWENANFQLFRVDKEAIAVAGNGWHDCEEVLCWTTTPFEIETFSPLTGTHELTIDFFAYTPPKNGIITIRTSDGKILSRVSASEKQIRVPLKNGWSRLVIEGDWPNQSPKEMGASSEDPRKLFLAVQRVSTKSPSAQETK